MIIELTKENLQKCGFDEEQIIKLLEWDKYDMFLIKDTCYYATNIEKKIFTEIDGFRKWYLENGTIAFPMDCPDLIPTFFDLFLKKYLDEQKELLNTMFVEADQKEIFINKQILAVKNEIYKNKEKILKRINTDVYYKKDSIYNSYLRLLENKLNEQPQQIETIKPDEVKKELHNYIFKDNAFEVFEKYHNNKKLAENSKTDLNLLFQLFKRDNLFLETVELKHYIQWLNSKYNYSLTELKKVNIFSKPNIQRTNDYKEYKKATLNQP